MTQGARRLAVLFFFVAITCDESNAKELIYAAVSDGRLEKIDLAGTNVGGFSIPAPPVSISVDLASGIYAVPFGFDDAYRFSLNGDFLNLITLSPIPGETGPPIPFGSTVDSAGRFYLGANTNIDRVERFLPDGTSLGIFAFTGPALSLAFDRDQNLFVSGVGEIHAFDPTGASLGVFASPPGFASDIAFDSTGNLYVVTDFSMITVYTPAGEFLRSFSTGISTHAIALDKNDVLYVGGKDDESPIHAVIHRFLPNGDPLGLFYQSAPAPRGRLVEIVDLAIVDQIPEPISIFLVASALFGAILRWPRRSANSIIFRSV